MPLWDIQAVYADHKTAMAVMDAITSVRISYNDMNLTPYPEGGWGLLFVINLNALCLYPAPFGTKGVAPRGRGLLINLNALRLQPTQR